MEKEYLTVPEAARLLDISDIAVYNRIKAGSLRSFPLEEVPPQCRHYKAKTYVLRSDLYEPRKPWHDLGWVDSREAAEMLGLKAVTLDFRIKRGDLTVLRLPSNKRRKGCFRYFDRAQVERVRDEPQPRIIPPYPYQPTPTDAAYLAGLLDGEGSITIQIRKQTGKDRHVVVVQICNTHHGVVEWAKQNFGGHIALVKRQRPQWRPIYHWITSCAYANHILCLLRPYLQIKKPQADLAIEFYDRMIAYNPHVGRPLTHEEQQWRDQQKTKISALNQRK